MVVVDSDIWIHYLRRPDTPPGRELVGLIDTDQVMMVGVVLAEVLQGARNERESSQLLSWLEVFPYAGETRETWARVGQLSMFLRQQGQAVPLTDLAVAAVALENDFEVYTLDEHFQRVPGLKLHQTDVEESRG